jgi:hypothetical protein
MRPNCHELIGRLAIKTHTTHNNGGPASCVTHTHTHGESVVDPPPQNFIAMPLPPRAISSNAWTKTSPLNPLQTLNKNKQNSESDVNPRTGRSSTTTTKSKQQPLRRDVCVSKPAGCLLSKKQKKKR